MSRHISAQLRSKSQLGAGHLTVLLTATVQTHSPFLPSLALTRLSDEHASDTEFQRLAEMNNLQKKKKTSSKLTL